jgi:hypothetical protein
MNTNAETRSDGGISEEHREDKCKEINECSHRCTQINTDEMQEMRRFSIRISGLL